MIVSCKLIVDDEAKEDMIEKIRLHNTECYQQQIYIVSALYEEDMLRKHKEGVPKKILCSDEGVFMGGSGILFMHFLFLIKENPKLFAFLVSEIEQSKELSDKRLDSLVRDMIELFFINFDSSRDELTESLEHFQELIKSHSEIFKDDWFNKRSFLNKLIKAYMTRMSNKEYTKKVFTKVFSKAYLKSKDEERTIRRSSTKSYVSDLETESFGSVKNESVVLEFSDLRKKTMSEYEDNPLESPKKLFDLCDEIINAMAKKLPHMPIHMRYLCKLLSKVSAEFRFIKKVIADLLYHYWLEDLFNSPNEYGVMMICYLDDVKLLDQLKDLDTLFKKVLYGIKAEDSDGYTSITNEYIETRSPMVDEYIKSLLDIDLPSIEKRSLVFKSCCISIENLKIVYDCLKAKVEEVKNIDNVCAKYLKRFEFNISKGIGVGIFKPEIGKFKYKEEEYPKLTAQQFEEAEHYIILQSVSVEENKEKTILNEKWQQAWHNLLLELDLTGCYNTSSSTIDIIEFLEQLYNYPNGFMVTKAKENNVKLLTATLIQYFKSIDKSNKQKEMEKLEEAYAKSLEFTLDKQQMIKYDLKHMIVALNAKIRTLKELKNQANNDIARIYAVNFITSFKFAFQLKNEQVKTSNGNIRRLVLNLVDPKSTMLTSKASARKSLKGDNKEDQHIKEY